MNAKELLTTSAEILLQYYQNNIDPFLNAMHPNILWIGPLEGQIIRSRDTLVNAFLQEQNVMKFHVFDLKASIAQHTGSQCDILLTFFVDSLYPNGSVIRCNQRILLSWAYGMLPSETTLKQNPVPLIITCFIANALPSHKNDGIYPNNFFRTSFAQSYLASNSNYFSTKGNQHELFYICDQEIIYVESKRPGCLIHTSTNDFYSSESVSEIHKKCEFLLRTHISYLVNPSYIQSIKRFHIALSNGTILPIPEKKYTAVKEQVTQALNKEDIFLSSK